MKLLILSNSGFGLMGLRYEVLQALAQEHTLVAAFPKTKDVSKLTQIGCKVVEIPLSRRGTNPIADLKLYRAYLALIRSEKPDAVLSYTIKPNVYGGMACAKTHTPFLPNVTGLGTSIENGGVLQKLTLSLYRKGLRGASCVFFQNADNERFFREAGVVSGRTRQIPGSGVNLTKHCAEAYPDETNGLRFVFAGRIMRDKGVGELLQAMQSLHEAHPEVSLDLLGIFDENYKEIIAQAEKGGFIRFRGFQTDVHSYYKNAHCTVLPSYHEGMANVLLESAACARPVIATNVPGCAETFEEGVTGLGCQAKSAESLLTAMEKFVALTPEQRREMGLRGREKMCREYDRQIVIDAYREEIAKIAKTIKKENN